MAVEESVCWLNTFDWNNLIAWRRVGWAFFMIWHILFLMHIPSKLVYLEFLPNFDFTIVWELTGLVVVCSKITGWFIEFHHTSICGCRHVVVWLTLCLFTVQKRRRKVVQWRFRKEFQVMSILTLYCCSCRLKSTVIAALRVSLVSWRWQKAVFSICTRLFLIGIEKIIIALAQDCGCIGTGWSLLIIIQIIWRIRLKRKTKHQICFENKIKARFKE